jgi:TonB family protein
LTRSDRLRLAAALAASAALHLWLLSLISPSPPSRIRPVAFTVELAARDALEAEARVPERQPERSVVAAPRSLGGARRDRPPQKASVSGRPVVSASLVSTPNRPPESALRDAASYLGEGQISVPPRIAGAFNATYPRGALEERRRGPVVVQLMIDADGSVAEAIALPGAQPDLAAAAVEALQYTRFIPARAGLLPARARVYFEVSFVIE